MAMAYYTFLASWHRATPVAEHALCNIGSNKLESILALEQSPGPVLDPRRYDNTVPGSPWQGLASGYKARITVSSHLYNCVCN